jgi:uncharacterized protein involved in exopolysaccharide biosynthesis
MNRKWMVLSIAALMLLGAVLYSAMAAQGDPVDASVVFGVS